MVHVVGLHSQYNSRHAEGHMPGCALHIEGVKTGEDRRAGRPRDYLFFEEFTSVAIASASGHAIATVASSPSRPPHRGEILRTHHHPRHPPIYSGPRPS